MIIEDGREPSMSQYCDPVRLIESRIDFRGEEQHSHPSPFVLIDRFEEGLPCLDIESPGDISADEDLRILIEGPGSDQFLDVAS